MEKINHLNYSETGFVYCEKHLCVVPFTEEFARKECGRCEMHNGSLQGHGVECLYENLMFPPPGPPIVDIREPAEYQKARHKFLDEHGK